MPRAGLGQNDMNRTIFEAGVHAVPRYIYNDCELHFGRLELDQNVHSCSLPRSSLHPHDRVTPASELRETP
jgi:hypothetical protein